MIRNILIIKDMKCLVNWSNNTEKLSDILIAYISAISDIASIITNENLIDIRLGNIIILLTSYERISIAIIHDYENRSRNGFNQLFDALFQAFQVQYNMYLDLPVIDISFYESFNQIIDDILQDMNCEIIQLQVKGGGS